MAEDRLSLGELERADEFARRHIGPDEAEIAAMLEVVGAASLDELIEQGDAARDPQRAAAGPAAGPERGRGARRAARDRRPEPRADLADRHGLLRHRHAARDPAQRAGESRLVHRLHALPGRGQPGPAGGAADLPADGRRPDRARARQRLAARRGDRGRRGHGDGPARRQEPRGRASSSTSTAIPRRSRCCGPAPRASASRSWSATRRATSRARRCSARSSTTPARAARCATSAR